MATSLQRQLKELKTPQTTLLQLDKKRPSLLFDPREAANLDRDAVFEIGVSGLEELKQLNPRFKEYEKVLFSTASKTFERSVQSASINSEISAQIDEFLILLSPYFVLRPAQKALEWLVNRYHVHQFNVEAWLMCILPYHDTKICVRALQLLDLSDPTSRWHWLFPLQKPGIPLSKLTLLRHCARDLSLLKFICSMMGRATAVHQNNRSLLSTFISFYTTTVIGAVEYSNSLEEGQITVLLPMLLEGLEPENPELLAGTYMIIAQMARKANFNQSALYRLVSRIIKSFTPTLALECVTLLVALYDVQKDFLAEVPLEVVTDITENESLVSAVASMAAEYHIASFVGPLIEALLLTITADERSDQAANFLQKLFADVKFEGQDVSAVVGSLLRGYLRATSQTAPRKASALEKVLKPVMEQLERQYPGKFETAAQEVLAREGSGESLKRLEKLLGLHYNSDQATLFLKLNHVDEDTRAAATRALITALSNGGAKTSEFLTSSIADRLKDSNPKVVSEVLKLGDRLVEILDNSGQLDLLVTAVGSVPTEADSPWKDIRSQLISLVCSEKFYSLLDTVRTVALYSALLRHLFPVAEDDVSVIKILTDSPIGLQSPLMTTLSTELKWTKQQTQEWRRDFCNRVFSVMEDHVPLSNPGLCSPLFDCIVRQLEEDPLNRRSFALIPTLVGSVGAMTDPKLKMKAALKAVQTLRTLAKHTRVTPGKSEITGSNFLEYYKNGPVPLELVARASHRILEAVSPNFMALQSLTWCDLDSPASLELKASVLLELLSFWTSDSTLSSRRIYRHYVADLLSRLGGLREKILFLSIAWAGHWVAIEPVLQLKCLRIAATLLKHTSEPLGWAVGFDSFVVPHLVAALTSPEVEVRRAVLSVMQVFSSAMGLQVVNGGYKNLADALTNATEELEADRQQLSIIVTNAIGENSSMLKTLTQLVKEPTTPDHVKRGLLVAMEGINTPSLLASLLPLLKRLLDEGELLAEGQLSINRSMILCQLLERFTPETTSFLGQTEGLNVFKRSLTCAKSFIQTAEGEPLSPQAIILEATTREFFTATTSKQIQQDIFGLLLDVIATTENTATARQARKALKRVAVDAALITQELQKLETPAEGMKLRETRTRRTRLTSVRAGQGTEWMRVLVVLEILQTKKKIDNVQLLVAPLFSLLKKCVDEEEQASLEYSKQLILSCLLFCCQRLPPGDTTISAAQFNTSLIVQCIRVSNNPQTQNHALLLLSLAAQMFPNHVLHNIMAIFTFMGTSVLRQDDAYSFQVIKRTVESVIPALIQASHKTAVEPIVTSVVHVFADALREVPEHRRIPVFDTLLSTLNPEVYLWLAPTLVLSKTVTAGPRLGNVHKTESEKERMSPDLEFCLSLCHQYTPQTQLKACIRIVEYLRTLPLEKTEKATAAKSGKAESSEGGSVPFDMDAHTTKQLCHFKLLLINFLTSLLSSDALVGQLLELNDSQRTSLEEVYSQLVQVVLQYTQSMARVVDNMPSMDQAPNPKFWRILLHRCYDVVDRINSLLPSKMFISVIHSLLSHALPSVRRRAMELISAKIQHQPEFFDMPSDQEALLNLLPILVSISQGTAAPHTEEITVNQQTALLTLKLLCRLLCTSNTAYFKPVLEMVTDMLDPTKTVPVPVLASAFLCLAELIQGMGIHALPLLPKFAPRVIHRWEDQNLDKNELLLLSVVTGVWKMVEVLPQFLIPYVVPILRQVCLLSVGCQNPEKPSQLQLRLQNIRHALAVSTAPRLLINAVSQVFVELTEIETGFKSSPAVVPLMSVLSESFNAMSREDLSTQLQTLTGFFLKALDSRSRLAKQPDNNVDDANAVESAVVDALVAMVLKLSEASFRPLLFQLFDWATRAEDTKERLITFYNATVHIAERLKGLFVLFAGHFIRNAAELTAEINQPKKELPFTGPFAENNSVLLLEYILRCLYRVCLHDSENFINKERFDILLQPLVDQLENELGGEERTKQRTAELLVPLLAQLAVAAGDDSLWKALHYQVLLKTRSNSHLVRLGALNALSALVEKLGEDYLALLPEAIPFLAELLEDDDNEVEVVAQNTIQHMENVLGEPLQKYF